MSTKRWIGAAVPVAQVDTLTIGGTIEVGDLFKVTINNKVFSFAATSTVAATNATAFVAAWNALSQSIWPEFQEMTAAATSGGALTITAKASGKPFTLAVSTTESDGSSADSQTFTRTATTANSGPSVADVPANWQGGVIPADGDNIVFDTGKVDVLYNLDQHTISPASITILPGYTGKIGLSENNTDGGSTASYPEYRAKYLQFGNVGDAQTVTVTCSGGGGRIKLDTGTAVTVLQINDTASSVETNVPTFLWKGSNTGNTLVIQKGSFGAAFFAGETSQLYAIEQGFKTNVSGDSAVSLGAGVTLTNALITQTGGTIEINSAITGTASVQIFGGTMTINGTGGVTGLGIFGGTVIYNTTGVLDGNVLIYGKGNLDFTQDLRPKTVTNPITVNGQQAGLNDQYLVVGAIISTVYTAGVITVDCVGTGNNPNINLGDNVTINRSLP